MESIQTEPHPAWFAAFAFVIGMGAVLLINIDRPEDVVSDRELATKCWLHHAQKGVDISLFGAWSVSAYTGDDKALKGHQLFSLKTNDGDYRRCVMTNNGAILESN